MADAPGSEGGWQFMILAREGVMVIYGRCNRRCDKRGHW